MGSLEHQLYRQNGPQLLQIHKITDQLIPTVLLQSSKNTRKNQYNTFFSETRLGDEIIIRNRWDNGPVAAKRLLSAPSIIA